MALESVGAFNNFSKSVNFQQTTKQTEQKVAVPVKKDFKTTISENKTPIIVGAIALAALGTGIYANKNKLFGKVSGTLVSDTKKIIDKINKIKASSINEANKVIADNTVFGEIKLPVIDKAAGMRSADKNQPERFHQAATWIEEAYKQAYSKAKGLRDGNNMLNYIYNRVNKENSALAQMYVQMPAAEANVRMTQFAKDVAAMDKHSGMTVERFVKDMKEIFMPKAKQELGI